MLILSILIAPAAAPVLGGLLIQRLSWSWAFYVNLPVGVAAVIFSVTYLVEHQEHAKGGFATWGLVISGGGLSALLYAISEGSTIGWTPAPVVSAAVCGLSALALFIRLELRRPDDPLLRIQLLTDRFFRATTLAVACSTASFLGVLYITPIFLQEALHWTALHSGMTTFVEAIGVVFSTQSLGRLYSRVGPRLMSAFGLVLLATIILAMTLVNPGRKLRVARALMFFAGFAKSTVFLPLQTLMFTGIASEDTGHASASSTRSVKQRSR